MKVHIVMGSQSDLKVMKDAIKVLKKFKIKHKVSVVSAHRTPEKMYEFAKNLNKNTKLIIAGAGGAAHLPGMLASLVLIPVIGVPVKLNNSMKALDSILSIVQMPKDIPVASVASNNSYNAALLAVQILSLESESLKKELKKHRKQIKLKVFKSNQNLKKLFKS